ncbi:hypothetical protein BGM09_26755 [Streptomyces sp. CBMA29]|nr:hypothetical protein [Streptomyces sp. CBMA29]
MLTTLCEKGPLTLKDLSEETGLVPPTALRTLRLMADEGFVIQQPDRMWRATMVMWRLGCFVNASVGIASLASKYTDRLRHDLDETAVYALFDQGDVTYTAHSEPATPVRAHARMGSRHGLLNVATGHAVLAWLGHQEVESAVERARQEGDSAPAVDLAELETLLASVRQQGYYSGAGRHWPELWGVAAAVFDTAGAPIGALGVSIPMSRVEERGQDAIEAIVREAASMTDEMGGRPPGRTPPA